MEFAHTDGTRYRDTAPDLPERVTADTFEGMQSNPHLFTSLTGYAIRRDGNHSPAYWMAYRPDAKGKSCLTPEHEIGAGAGDAGWAKCVLLCEMHEAEQKGRSNR